MSLQHRKVFAIVMVILGIVVGVALSNMYMLALVLGVGTLYLTIIEFQEDWSIAVIDLAVTGLLTIGGSQIGVFGFVVGMGIAFGASLFLPSTIRNALPWLSVKYWRERRTR